MSRPSILPEQLIARCRRAAVVLAGSTELPQRERLAQELADLLALLAAVSAESDAETRAWLEGEGAAVRASVLTEAVCREAPAWAAPLLLPRDLLAAMEGEEYGE